MSRFVILAAFIQAVVLHVTYGQCINRVIPNLGCSNILPVETILPNQVIYNQLPNVINSIFPNSVNPNVLLPNIVNPNVIFPNNIVAKQPCGCGCQNVLPIETILPNQVVYNGVETVLPGAGPVTVIQDSSVANNLANALQLLVVSNLLSNTLPVAGDVVAPCGLGGYYNVY